MQDNGSSDRERGNTLLGNGDISGAIKAYSDGIEAIKKSNKTSDELHLLLSNRAAAKMKAGDVAGALEDADACVLLRPMFAKGYGRKGAALFQLGRYGDALEAYENGMAIDKGNKTLMDGIVKCKDMIAKETAEKEKDDPMASFLNEIEELEENAEELAATAYNALSSSSSSITATQHEKPEQAEPVYKVDHEAETKDWDGLNQIERILCNNYEWVNANPFEVMGIKNEDATAEDIKKRYHKLSALLHPDKNKDPRTQEAFQEVKTAYEILKNQNARELNSEIIRQCRKRVNDTRKRLRQSGLTEDQIIEKDGTVEEACDRAIKLEFASRKRNRMIAEQNRRSFQNREATAEEEERLYWQNVKQFEEEVRNTREDRKKNWEQFSKSKHTNNKRRKLEK